MSAYYVNKIAQSNGDHEVHESGCNYLPSINNRIDLGNHYSCESAVQTAIIYFSQVNGCYWCSRRCHTS